MGTFTPATGTAGWATYSGTPANIYYIDNTPGVGLDGDTISGTSPTFNTATDRPFASLNYAMAALNNRIGATNPVECWILIRKGNVHNDSLAYFNGITAAGLSASNPIILSSYEPSQPTVFDPVSANARPLIIPPVGHYVLESSGLLKRGSIYTGDYLAVIGLDFYQSARDPKNAATQTPFYSSLNDNDATPAFSYHNPFNFFYIENCRFRSFFTNLSVFATNAGLPAAQNFIIRRSVVADAWSTVDGSSTGQGLGAVDHVQNSIVEQVVFDRNGPGDQGLVANSHATVYKHNMYFSGLWPDPPDPAAVGAYTIFRGNIFSREWTGAQMRSGYIADDNLFVDCAYTNNFSANTASLDCKITNNVTLAMKHQLDYLGGGIGNGKGFLLNDAGSSLYAVAKSVTIDGNIAANQAAGAGDPAYEIDALWSGVVLSNNIAFNWSAATPATCINDLGTGTVQSGNKVDATGANTFGFPAYSDIGNDPKQLSVGSYYAHIGGTNSEDAFLTQARNNCKDNWNDAYTATAVNNYVRAGFSVAAYYWYASVHHGGRELGKF